MKKAFDQYQRVARGFFGCSSFWQGRDHLLYVSGVGIFLPVKETYYRLEYQRIKALAAIRTRAGLYLNIAYIIIILLMLLVLGGLVYWRANTDFLDNELVYVFAALPTAMILFFMVLLIINILRGPTCKFEVQTTAQNISIAPLNRWRAAQKAIRQLEPIITAYQDSVRQVPPVPATIEQRTAVPTEENMSEMV